MDLTGSMDSFTVPEFRDVLGRDCWIERGNRALLSRSHINQRARVPKRSRTAQSGENGRTHDVGRFHIRNRGRAARDSPASGRATVTRTPLRQHALFVWMSVDSVNLIFKGVLNRIQKADVAGIQALCLNCRIRFGTPLSDKAVRKRRFGDMVAFGQIGTSDASVSL